jgi:hypothetical protein
MAFAGGVLRLTFGQTWGQPKDIRFRGDGGTWGDWLSFQKELSVRMAARPKQYQLRSRLDVISPPRELTE